MLKIGFILVSLSHRLMLIPRADKIYKTSSRTTS